MATNKVYCSYQEVIDMHTEQGHATAIGIHTPVGDTPRKMFSGFFDQFKRYKYLGCSISFVPVATLPADPSQIAVDGGDYSIDPRDLVNPIMFHGCHGDDMGTILNRLYGDNTEVSDAFDVLDYDAAGGDYGNAYANLLARLYYKALTDNTWKKAHPQKGFRKKGLRPLVYSVATNRQLDGNAVGIDNPNMGFPYFEYGDPTSDIGEDDGQAFMKIDKQNIQLFTPRLTGLGWMDTRNVLTSRVDVSLGPGETTLDQILSGIQKGLIDQVRYAELPKIYMGMILLAPAFKTEMWFRVILNHHFCFKDFRGISFKPEVTGVPSYTNAEDIYDPETYDDIPLDDGGDEPEPDPPTPPAQPLQIGYLSRSDLIYQGKTVTFYQGVKVRSSDEDEWHDVYFSGTDVATHQVAHAFSSLFYSEDFSTPWGWSSNIASSPICLTALSREESTMVWDEYTLSNYTMNYSKSVPYEYTLEPNAYTQQLINAIENNNYQLVVRSA